jgi:hypothetical protein
METDVRSIDWARHGEAFVALPDAFDALHSEDEEERGDALAYFEHEVFRAGGPDIVVSAALLDAIPCLADFAEEDDEDLEDEQATVADLLVMVGTKVGPEPRDGEPELVARTRAALDEYFPIALEAAP